MQNDSNHLKNLDLIRFPLIVLVVFIHSFHPVLETMGPTAQFVWHFIRDGTASVAVPSFFFISGYLFFHKMDWSRSKWLGKLKSRFFSIALPYVIWTLFYWAGMLLIKRNPEWTLPQFWYLQELALLCLLAPVFHFLHKKGYLTALLFTVVWLFFDWKLNAYFLTSMLPIMFFYAGSVWAVKGYELESKFGVNWVFFMFSLVLFTFSTLNPSLVIAQKLGVIFGVVAVFWFAEGLSRTKLKTVVMSVSGASFFVFALHEPLVQFVIADLNILYQPVSDAGKLALYFAAPVITILACLNTYNVLNFFAPGFTKFLSGGRS